MKIPFSPGDSVFGYGRDSGGDEQDLSVTQQEQALRDWCAQNGLILTCFYKDEARKGSSTIGRNELQSMLYAFRHGCAERGVIVWKYNRFARSVDNAQFMRAEIRTLGYVFYSITDNVPDGPMGRLFEAAIDFKDEQYLLDLSTDIKRALHDLVRLYGCVPGKPPTGFIRQPVDLGLHRNGLPHIAHRWIPDPDLAPRILQAFELRANKHSLRGILKETRLPLAVSSLKTFFSNPIYTGILEFGDLTLPAYCEPIVPRSVWDAVQIVQQNYQHRHHLTSPSNHPRRLNSRFLLSGLCFCALCDHHITGHSSHQRNGHVVDTYICKGRDHSQACKAERIPKADLERLVISTLREYILDPKVLAAAYESNVQSQASLLAEGATQRKQLTKDLQVIKYKLNNIADAISQNGTSLTLNQRLSKLETERVAIESSLSNIASHSSAPIPKYTDDQIKALLARVETIFAGADLPTQRSILHAFIDRITVQREKNKLHGIIYYYYSPL